MNILAKKECDVCAATLPVTGECKKCADIKTAREVQVRILAVLERQTQALEFLVTALREEKERHRG